MTRRYVLGFALALIALVGVSVSATAAPARQASAKKVVCGQTRVNPFTDRYGFIVAAVRGTTCHHGATVIRRVAKWADFTKHDLGVSKHPSTYGYRCAVAASGDADWRITCRRGPRTIYAGAAG